MLLVKCDFSKWRKVNVSSTGKNYYILFSFFYSHDNNNTIKKRGPKQPLQPQTDQQDNLIEELTTLIKPKYLMEENNTPSPQISSGSSPERTRPNAASSEAEESSSASEANKGRIILESNCSANWFDLLNLSGTWLIFGERSNFYVKSL